jgi:hypothetical protein
MLSAAQHDDLPAASIDPSRESGFFHKSRGPQLFRGSSQGARIEKYGPRSTGVAQAFLKRGSIRTASGHINTQRHGVPLVNIVRKPDSKRALRGRSVAGDIHDRFANLLARAECCE